ncbi:hypothetical protein CROQUDRAFT_653886 [Cronartium quercuum f. sp. fusiforme G11]|uniref:CFEM domain-containing protein n=1 Tax=Cronartium quercuum f. sp. fusiforme G11 TaxID=708437 RepID=A0A9P6NLK1_9BASI|nr:hypothetical protein CROQUDRAFT_653886 [Cronartium quercuum f. sp. fusiforme G11]
MLSSITIALSLIPSLAIAFTTLDTVPSILNATALPECALTCTLDVAPTTKCTHSADIKCVCTDHDFRLKAEACFKKTCDEAAHKATTAYDLSACATAGYGGPSTTHPDPKIPNLINATISVATNLSFANFTSVNNSSLLNSSFANPSASLTSISNSSQVDMGNSSTVLPSTNRFNQSSPISTPRNTTTSDARSSAPNSGSASSSGLSGLNLALAVATVYVAGSILNV